MKLVRIAAVVIGGLLALAAISAIVVAWTFDPNAYRETIQAEFERRTGRSLSIERELTLEYFPWLAVETGGLVVGNAPGHSERAFARVEHLAARIELVPLVLDRAFSLGTIEVDGLDLNLEVDADGRGNWLLGAAATRTAPAADGGPAASGWLERLDVDGLRIRDATVTWRDLAADRTWSMTELAVTTGAYERGAPVDVETAFRFADATTRADAVVDARASVEYVPGAGLELRAGRAALELSLPDGPSADVEWRFARLAWPTDDPIAVTDSELSGSFAVPVLGARRHEVAVATPRAELDPSTGAIDLTAVTTSVDGLTVRSDLAGTVPGGTDARLAGRVVVDAGSLATLLDAVGVAAPANVEPAALGTFDLAAELRLELEPLTLELADVDARALGMRATGTGAWHASGQRVTASLAVPAFEPGRALTTLLAPHVPDYVALDALEPAGLTLDADVDTRTRAVELRNVRAELLGTTFEARADVALGDGGITAGGTLATPGIAARAIEAAFGTLPIDAVDGRELGTLAFDTTFRYDGAADRLDLDPLALDAFGLSTTGRLTAAQLSSAPVLTGRARIAELAPRALMRRLGLTPPATSDPGALSRASLETGFEITREHGELRELTLGLDDSRITGEVSVDDFDAPAYGFALAIDGLDADRYLPPPAQEAEAGERTAGDLELSGEALDTLRLDGRVSVGELTLAGLSFSGVATRIELGRGRFALDGAEASLYGGRFDGAFGVDASGDTPRMSLTGRAERIDVAPLLADLTGDAARISGRGDVALDLAGTGATVTENVRSAAGTLELALRDGAIEGFDLGRTLCAAYNAMQRLPRPPAAEPPRTRYTLLRGAADVAEGVATSPDLLARTAFMDVTGRGSLDFVEQTLDYTLDAELTAPIEITGCESMTALVGDSIPLTLRGTTTAPEIRPDFGEILERSVEDALRDRASERLEERLRERLRDLF